MTASILDHLAECCPSPEEARRALEQEAPQLVKPAPKPAKKPAKKALRR
jgi:hypothetical protein